MLIGTLVLALAASLSLNVYQYLHSAGGQRHPRVIAVVKPQQKENVATKPAPPTVTVAGIPLVPIQGDTLSHLCNDLYGSGKKATYEAAAKVVVGIRNPNKPDFIRAFHKLVFPADLVVGSKTIHADKERAKRHWARRHSKPFSAPPPVETPDAIPAAIPTIVPGTPPASTSVATAIVPIPTLADVDTVPPILPAAFTFPLEEATPPTVGPSPRQSNGYRLTIPADVANEMQLKKGMLGGNLNTCIVPLGSARQCDLVSRLDRNKKSGDVTLAVSLREIPSQPFTLIIDGFPPMNGQDFAARAAPFQGRFPGPSKFKKRLWFVGKMGERAGMGLLLSGGNPIIAAIMAGGPPTMSAVLGHYARKAEKKARNATKASLRSTSTPTSN
jgi:hypothetical protein